jgi:hypothetical protein
MHFDDEMMARQGDLIWGTKFIRDREVLLGLVNLKERHISVSLFTFLKGSASFTDFSPSRAILSGLMPIGPKHEDKRVVIRRLFLAKP